MYKKIHAGVVVLSLVTLWLLLSTAASGAEKAKDRPAQAIIAGGVYDEAGYALPGIRIKIRRGKERKPQWEAVSDARGEFAVRVPAGPQTYVVSTHSKEHLNQEQPVEIYGRERTELIFRLAPQPKKDTENRK